MFSNPQPLSANTHRDLRYRNLPDFSFAREIISAPITFTEMLEAAKYYPVVFPQEGTPVVLLGAEGQNLFVDGNGQWTVPYMPAHISRYPFILGNTDREDEMVVMVDEGAAHFQTDEGERLFEEDGTPTQVVERVKSFLGTYQEEVEKSMKLTARLFETGVLEERALKRNRDGEQTTVIRQFFVVSQEKFNALSKETILAWHSDGTLPLVYAHFMSLTNLRHLKA
jgi:hypothetical protein